MTPQYATWSHSTHREHAHCNDCHVPHNNILNKYYFKAKDGMSPGGPPWQGEQPLQHTWCQGPASSQSGTWLVKRTHN